MASEHNIYNNISRTENPHQSCSNFTFFSYSKATLSIIMASEQPTRTLYAPAGKKFNTMGSLWAALLDLSNEGDPVAKDLVVSWQTLKSQSQIIVNQLCVKE